MNSHGSSFVLSQDPSELYDDFYDTLFIQCLLQHASTSQFHSQSLSTPRKTPIIRSDWHRFLDYLCFLCDWKCGGRGVAALGAEKAAVGTIFWLATTTTSPEAQDEIQSHVSDIIGLLNQSIHRTTMKTGLITEIAQLSIARSYTRVRHYRRRLGSLIEAVRSGDYDSSTS